MDHFHQGNEDDDWDEFEPVIVQGEDGGSMQFKSRREADAVRRAIENRPKDAACPRIVPCMSSCGGGFYQARWGQDDYCWKCGCLL